MVRHLGTICAVALGWTSLAAASFMNLPLHDLFLRDDSSCATNYTSCGSSYPSDFCCSSDTTCLGLDNYTTVLCCPTGANCTYIEPITCNVQALNATANPTAPIKSTLLSDTLPSCADGCCPFGYTCASNTTCVLDESTSSEADSSSSSSATSTATTMVSSISGLTVASATPSTISISDSSPAATTAASSAASSISSSSMTTNSTTQTKTTDTCDKFPATAVVAGFFPGAVAGALAAAMIMMCRRRSDKQRAEDIMALKAHRSSGGAIIGISDPIPDDENGSFRTDFLLQRKLSGRFPAPGSVSRPKSRILRKSAIRVKSIFIGPNNSIKRNKHDDSPQWNSASPPPPVPAIPGAGELPVTPPQQTGPGSRIGPRQPSTESIKVYSPPNMLGINNGRRPEDRNTTFSEVMEKAGFQNWKGEPSYRVEASPSQKK